MKRVLAILWRYRYAASAALLFAVFAYLRFFDTETRAVFGYDQVTNSWVMRAMITSGKLPLLGMVAKGNTGFYIGPAYYYLLAPFYWAFRLDPVAGMVFVGFVGVATFWILYAVLTRLFSRGVALASLAVYTFSYGALSFDRTPWPVVLIPLTSALIFYFLYRVLTGSVRSLVPLAAAVGFAFHTHFTAVYFVLIILVCSPWILRQRGAWKYTLLGIGMFVLWLLPNIVSELGTGFRSGNNMAGYLKTYYLGFHLVRVLQLTHDALIEYVAVLFDGLSDQFPAFARLSHVFDLVLTGLFFAVFATDRKYTRNRRLVVIVLTVLWFVVPWFVMATYRGEISNYYFSSTRPVVVFILGYLLWRFARIHPVSAVVTVLLLVVFANAQIGYYLKRSVSHLPDQRRFAKQEVQAGRRIEYVDGQVEPYLYEYYMTVGRDKLKD